MLSEENAKRRVVETQRKYRMHTIEKHGPEIPDVVLRQRAIDGTDPITGTPGRLNKSSQFKSWRIQMHALNEALTRKTRGLPAHTGFDREQNPIVRVKMPGAGRGYKPNRRDRQNPIFNENMNGAEIKFDKVHTDRPFTGFPID